MPGVRLPTLYPLLLVLASCNGQPQPEQMHGHILGLRAEIAQVEADQFRRVAEMEAQLIEFREHPEIQTATRAAMQTLEASMREADAVVLKSLRAQVSKERERLCAMYPRDCAR